MMKTELVFIPLPITGHLVSTVQLAKLLVSRDDELSIKILIFKLPFESSANSCIQSLQTETIEAIQFVEIPEAQPQAQFSGKQENPFFLISKLVDSQKPQVRDLVAQFKGSGSSRLAGFVVDMFCTGMIDVANEFEVPTYVFFSSGAAVLGLWFHIQSLVHDSNVDVSEFKDSETEFSVSTYVNPVPAKLCPQAMLDNDGVTTKHARRFVTEAKGILINTFLDLESYAIKAHNSNQKMPTIYPIGPLLNSTGTANNQQETDIILQWLDEQPVSSVVFLCFGSMGSFEGDQVKEIAYAIEHSGCRFLWSLRSPPQKGRIGSPGEYENHEEVLPEGFLERTAGVGKVIGWAPQAQVLAHPAVGGFVTHCGWNSVLESVWFGVPMAAWPMYAEQQLNAFLLVKDLGIAVEIMMDYKKDFINGTQIIVQADKIEDGIRKLMQPDGEIKRKVKELKERARTALVEGGSSYISLGSLIEDFHGSH